LQSNDGIRLVDVRIRVDDHKVFRLGDNAEALFQQIRALGPEGENDVRVDSGYLYKIPSMYFVDQFAVS
jgi:hypothetical protein